jgi:hypothetical protein
MSAAAQDGACKARVVAIMNANAAIIHCAP